jgi:hypothetical protein
METTLAVLAHTGWGLWWILPSGLDRADRVVLDARLAWALTAAD